MCINYSLGLKTATPGKKKPKRKVYATAQYTRVCDTQAIMQYVVKHTSVQDRGEVMSVVCAVVDCMKERLLDGDRIELGELGTFYCVIKGTGAETTEKFDPRKNIKGVSVNWRPGKAFRDLSRYAKYRLVVRRATAAKRLRRDLEDLASKLPARQPAKRLPLRPAPEFSPEETRERQVIAAAEALMLRLAPQEEATVAESQPESREETQAAAPTPARRALSAKRVQPDNVSSTAPTGLPMLAEGCKTRTAARAVPLRPARGMTVWKRAAAIAAAMVSFFPLQL